MGLSGSNIKKILIFSKKSFSYISEKGTPHKKDPIYFRKPKFTSSKNKKTLLKSSLSFRK